MKYRLNCTIFFLLFCSCSKPNFYQLRINDIPTKSPNYNAQILFYGDRLPTEPYFEVIDFEVPVDGKLSRQDIKRRMEIEAIKEGVDAIINVEASAQLIESGNILTILLDMLDEDYDPTIMTSNQTFIYGKGIMYLKNLNYIHQQPEYEYFYIIDLDTGFPKPFFKIEYKLTGQVYMVYPETENALDIFKEYFQYYSDFHLLKQREMWTYKKKGGRLVKRILWDENGVVTKVCRPEYDEQDRLIRVAIMSRVGGLSKEEATSYAYGKDEKLRNRLVETYDGTKIYEEYNYIDDELTGKKILLNLQGGKQIHLSSSIQYYDPDYLKEVYFNEIAQQ